MMKTSKILFTSLIAAAAMSTVPAWATEYTIGTSDNNDARIKTATAEDLLIFNKASGHLTSGGAEIVASVRIDQLKLTDGYSNQVYTFKNSVTGTGEFTFAPTTGANNQTYVFEGDVSGYSGNMSIASGKYGTFTFSGKTGTGTITAENASSVLNLNGATVSNSEITVSTVNISGATSFVSTTDLNSGNITVASGATVGIADTGKLDLSSSTINVSGTLSNAGTLDLSGATVTLASAISNSGTVTVNSSSVFALTDALKTAENTYKVIDGGTISGWDSLAVGNFTLDGVAVPGRSEVNVETAGVVSITSVAWNLFWNGGAAGTWNTTEGNTIWGKDSAGGDATAFVSGDNVTFNTSGDVAVTVASSGVTAGTMNVSAGTVTLSGGKVTATGGVVIDNGATLKYGVEGALAGAVTVNSGGTFDMNGYSAESGAKGLGTVTLAGGTLTNTGTDAGTDKQQLYTLAVTADSEINGTGNFGLIGSYYGATTLDLGGKTLTVNVGSDKIFYLVNTTISAGTLKIKSGTVSSHDAKPINGSAADFVIESAGTLNMGTGALSAKSISGAGTVKFGSLSSLPTTFTTDWTGTVAFTSISDVSGVGLTLSNLGNSNSKIVFDGVSGTGTGQSQGLWFNPETYNVNIEIASGGLTLTNGSSSSPVVLSGALSGTGTFEFAGTVAQAFKFTGNLSDFTGTLKSTKATFEFAGAADQTFSGTLDGSATLVKSGTKTLTMSGDNSAFTGGVTISAGTLVAGSAKALGTGAVSVAANAALGLVAETTVTVEGGVALAKGAKIVVDMTGVSKAETFTLDLLTGTALTYGTMSITSTNVGTLLGDAIELSNWTAAGEWVKSLSFADGTNTLSLTMTIPEPSTFGLLAGVGALALVVARRRRRAK